MDFAQAIASSIHTEDEADGRIYGFLYGIVTNNKDPQALGRVQARIGAQGKGDSHDWLLPIWPGGIEAIPNINDPVIVGFIDGDPHRGFYCYTPKTTTQKRAAEAMLLGYTFAGMYNHFVSQFNTLKASFNNHTHTGGDGGFGATGPATTSASDANKLKAWDGSVPSNINDSRIVLSDMAMVRTNATDATRIPQAIVPPLFKK